MGHLRHLAVVLALVLSLLAPTMACALPNAQMTVQEHACCQKMKGKCGSMRMPASHSCCQPRIQTGHFEALQPESASVPVISFHAVLPLLSRFDLRPVTCERVSWPQHSPPVSPPPTRSVLRL